MNLTSEVIVAEGIGRRFGRTWALRGVDFVVRKGEITGLIGADGSGKTTLLQILAAILDPTEGTCMTLGYDTRRQSSSVTRRIGYMAQGFTLYDRLTVSENLNFAAKVRNVPPADLSDRRDRLLNMANLSAFLDRREGDLSGGMRKKLALCTNLIHEPPLLLLDEPGLGVDPISRRELWQVLDSYRSEGTTIVVSTSYMDEAQRCDRVIFLEEGRIIDRGEPEELCGRATGSVFRVISKEPQTAEAVLSQDPATLALDWRSGEMRIVTRSSDKVVERLAGTATLQPTAPNLQDAFLLMRPASGSRVTLASDFFASEYEGAPKVDPGTERPRYGIATRSLTKRFGDFTAVDAVDLEIHEGEIFGLLGANGAGKTTLIRMLCGLQLPSEGTASVAGLDLFDSPYELRERIGYVSQRFSLYFDLSIDENLRFFASAYGIDRYRARRAAKWSKNITGLVGIADQAVANLSAAVRQRVALAAAIIHDPSVLFLDEPTSGVDPTARTRFWHLIRLLAQRGTTVLVTTHYMDEAAYCDRLGFMHEGRLVAVGTLPSLRSGLPADTPNNPEDIFLGYMLKESVERGASPRSMR